MNKDRIEETAKKAYELFEKSGREHGRDFEHWLEAEKIVLKKYATKGIAGASEKVQKAAKAASSTVRKEVKKAVSSVKAAAKGTKKTRSKQA